MSFRKNLILPFLFGIIPVIMIGYFGLVFAAPAIAQTSDSSTVSDECHITDIDKAIRLSVHIPGVTEMIVGDKQGNRYPYVQSMACFIADIYRYLAGVAGILAVTMIIYGGIKYTVSFGNPSKLQDARDTITSAMIGLALVLGSYVILNFINPRLTSLQAPNMPVIHKQLFFWDNGSYWCEDQNQADFKAVDSAKTTCGGMGVRADGQNCYYRTGCDIDNGQMCILNTDDLTAKCGSAEAFCTAATDCTAADKQIQLAGILPMGCTHPLFTLSNRCFYREVLDCASKWDQVACDVGGNEKTPCWEKDAPAISEEYYCKDSRGLFQSDAICCADLWNDVDCRTACNDDEIAAPNCKLQNSLGSMIDVRKPDGGSDSCDDAQLANGMKCCVELKLQTMRLN